MKSNISFLNKRRWFLFGPGTILALLAAVGIAVSGRLARQATLDPNAGRIVFEADSQGKMQPIGAPSHKVAPLPALWKPEPGLMLAHTSELKLQLEQCKKITKLNADWIAEKANLQEQIAKSAATASTSVHSKTMHHDISVTQVTSSLTEYSQLSRDYDVRRADYWQRSLAILSNYQQQYLGKLANKPGGINQP